MWSVDFDFGQAINFWSKDPTHLPLSSSPPPPSGLLFRLVDLGFESLT